MGRRDRKKHPGAAARRKSYARLSTRFFKGVDAKLRRAGEHFKLIEREIAEVVAPNPDHYITHYDASRQEMITRGAPMLFEPRDRWSTIIGDCVHNLRSALDHLAHDLVTLGGGTPVVGRSGTQFPIYDTRVGGKGGARIVQINSAGGTVTPDALAFIEGLQPYWCPDGPNAHPLWVLGELDNMDKHRTLALTTVALKNGLSFQIREMWDVNVHFGHTGAYAGAFDENTDLARSKVTVTGPDPHMNMQPQGTIDIQFAAPCLNAGQPVRSTLSELRDYVTDVAEILMEIGLRTATI